MGARLLDQLNIAAAALRSASPIGGVGPVGGSGESLVGAVVSAVQVSRQVDGLLVELTARLEGSLGRGATIDVLQVSAGMDGRSARRLMRRARVAGRFSSLAALVRHGHASAEVLDVVDALWRPLNDAEQRAVALLDGVLAELAAARPLHEFASAARRLVEARVTDHRARHGRAHRAGMRASHWIDGHGFHHLRARFDAETGAKVFAAVEAATARGAREQANAPASEQLDRSQLEAVAVGELICGGSAVARRPVDVAVIVDYEVLRVGTVAAGQRCETATGQPLSAAAARRLACDAHLIPVVLGGAGEVLDVGRARRLATRAQRLALLARFRTCAVAGCDVPFHRCEIHHVAPFEAGGPTDLANLVPLCARHHHHVHDHPGCRLEHQGDGVAIVGPPRSHDPPGERAA